MRRDPHNASELLVSSLPGPYTAAATVAHTHSVSHTHRQSFQRAHLHSPPFKLLIICTRGANSFEIKDGSARTLTPCAMPSHIRLPAVLSFDLHWRMIASSVAVHEDIAIAPPYPSSVPTYEVTRGPSARHQKQTEYTHMPTSNAISVTAPTMSATSASTPAPKVGSSSESG